MVSFISHKASILIDLNNVSISPEVCFGTWKTDYKINIEEYRYESRKK